MRNGIDAMEATPPGRSILEVSVKPLDGKEVQVSVSDRGCGLPEVGDEVLFEPFFSTKPMGMGLGLSISRSIIASHGGRLWYSKNSNGGTTFFFTLPVVGEATDD
jgi:signal transduction histidine kinase